jgi:hypothetical protein
MLTVGGVVSRITLTLAVLTAPPALVPVAVIGLVPSRSTTPLAVNVPPLLAAETPFTVTTALGSSTVPVTVIPLAANNASGAGVVIDSLGPCRLTLTADVELFPATSVACTEIEIEPCVICTEQLNVPPETVAGVLLQVTFANPESASLEAPATGTFAVCVTLASVGEAILTKGGVWSRLTVALALTELPTASVAIPVITWFAPSMLTICVPGHETGGAPPVQTKLTVTGVLFHPAAFGAGATEATTCNGGNGCRLNWVLVVAVLPAMSVALPVKVCRPAVVTVIGVGQMATPDKLSLQVNVTVAETALTIPFASGTGETTAEMVGGVLSRLIETLVLAVWPAASVTVPLTA